MKTVDDLKGKEIGRVECSGCGADLPLKVNRAGGVYYFCANVLERDQETGKATEKCLTRFNFGRRASQKVINEYLAANTGVSENVKGAKIEQERETREQDNGNKQRDIEPERTREPEPENKRSFTGKLAHFLTADE